jgi:transposase
MAVAVPLRSDFEAAQLRALAKRARDPDQTRRLLARAAIYDGASRTEAAQIGCVTLQIVRDWVLRFNARGPEGLRTGRAPGAPPRLTDQHRQALQALVEQGPSPAIHGVVRWRLIDLIQWLWEEVAVGGVPPLPRQADAEPRAAGHELSQALGPPAPSREERGGGLRF